MTRICADCFHICNHPRNLRTKKFLSVVRGSPAPAPPPSKGSPVADPGRVKSLVNPQLSATPGPENTASKRPPLQLPSKIDYCTYVSIMSPNTNQPGRPMNPFSPFAFSPAPTHRQTTTGPVADPDPQADSPPGRPRALDGPKRADFLELLSGGFDLEHAARQVRCSVRTIRREMKRDPSFARAVRRSEIFSLQNPLSALQHALHKNWRVAAWLLERLFPERFARRPQTTAFGKRQARQLLNEVLRIVDAEVIDEPQRDCINGRIRATFEYFTHVYCARKRSKADLRRAIELFEKNDAQRDLEWLASNCKATPSPMCDQATGKVPSHENDGAPLLAPSPRRGRDQTSTGDPIVAGHRRDSVGPSAVVNRVAKGRGNSSVPPKSISETFQDLIDDLKAFKKASRSKSSQNETKTDEVLSPTMSSGAFAGDKMDKTISVQCAEIPANS
jgi:hypothetical protein